MILLYHCWAMYQQRVMMGVFEAGLAPGLAYYVSFWYRANERSIRLAMIYSTATLAGAFSGLLAYGILHLNQSSGLEGWRWCKSTLYWYEPC